MTIIDKTNELLALWVSYMKGNGTDLERAHDALKSGAQTESYYNSGGGCMLSETLHRLPVGAGVADAWLLTVANDEAIYVYRLPFGMDHDAAVEYINSHDGCADRQTVAWASFDHLAATLGDAGKALAYDEAVTALTTAQEINAAHERAIALLRGALAGLVEHCADWTDAPEHLVAAGCAALDATAG